MAGVRSAQKLLTRTKIINSALNLMTNMGTVASVSMREVAREAGIAPTSFYRHFKDLDEVNLAIVQEGESLLVDAAENVLNVLTENPPATHNDELRFIVQSFVERLVTSPNLMRFVVGARYSCSQPVRKAVEAAFAKVVKTLAEAVEQASVARQRPLAQPRVLAEAIIAIIFGVGLRAQDMHEDERPFLIEVILQQIKMLTLGAEALRQQAEES